MNTPPLADVRALCAHLGIPAQVKTDAFGRTDVYVDEAGLRRMADHAPIGRKAAHAWVDQQLAARGIKPAAKQPRTTRKERRRKGRRTPAQTRTRTDDGEQQ